jgi:hypothetical protein
VIPAAFAFVANEGKRQTSTRAWFISASMFAAKYWSRLSLSSAQENWDIGEDVSFHCGLGSTERKAHDGHLKALLINLLGHGFSFTSKNSISRHLVH